MSKSFQDFINSCDRDISKKQSSRIEEHFNGNFSAVDLTAELIAEARATTYDFLQAYHNWLFDNFDISPKKK